jgi:YVTN family beta-propeller protein
MRPGATRATGVLGAAVFLLLALVLATATGAGVARADGGAPNLVYVAQGGGGLVVIDIAKRQVVGRMAVGGAPSAVLLSYDSRFVYVAQRATGRVAIVNARTQQVEAELPVGASPQAMVLGLPNLLYVANSGGNSVTVLDPDARRTLATIAVGMHPASRRPTSTTRNSTWPIQTTTASPSSRRSRAASSPPFRHRAARWASPSRRRGVSPMSARGAAPCWR